MREHPCKDHLGNEYPSLTARAKAWGHSNQVVAARLRYGWSLERALAESSALRATAPDGARYHSKRAMCEAYDVDYGTYMRRIQRGWSEEDALFPRKGVQEVVAPDGTRYGSVPAMCKAYGVCYTTYIHRVKRGLDMKEALSSEGVRAVTGPDGTRYPSIAAMCRAHGVSYSAFSKRRRAGLSLDEALRPSSR